MDAFRKLGDEITRRWEKQGRDIDRFPEIASSSLAASSVFAETSISDVARWLLFGSDIPAQEMRAFGQPPLNMYDDKDFHIELRFWIDSPLTIHQHAFSGAFAVLSGSSFHSTYSFTREQEVGRQLILGQLEYRASELLGEDCVRTILTGDRFIHSLLHLEQPTVTIAICTTWQAAYAPQYRYYPPGVGIDPRFNPEPLTTQLALLATLQRTHYDLFCELALKNVRTGSLWTAYKTAELVANRDIHSAFFSALMAAITARDELLGSALGKAFRDHHRQALVKHHLDAVSNPGERFLLAMLLYAPDRRTIDDLIFSEFPQSKPGDKIISWCEGLAKNSSLGIPSDNLALLLKLGMRNGSFAQVAKGLELHFPDDAAALARARSDWHALSKMELFKPLLGTAGNGFQADFPRRHLINA